jgi:hypothetical protein
VTVSLPLEGMTSNALSALKVVLSKCLQNEQPAARAAAPPRSLLMRRAGGAAQQLNAG